MARVVVGMSGGVDSAVAALLLCRQGHEVTGVFMRNWEETDPDGVCPADEEYEDVRRVCRALGIAHYAVNFSQEYRQRVFDAFLAELRAGRTPNPDVLCNTEVKFNAFLDYALAADADWLATGHYADIRHENGQHTLLRAADENKDQTYFLHGLSQSQLARVLFPLAGYTKPQVRALAEQAGLPVAQKKDSTGICFIGERNFREFLKQHLPTQPGDMVTPEGEVVGRHEGLAFYTIGQRRGLGIGGRGDGQRWFVLAKRLAQNQLVVHQGEDNSLYTHSLTTQPAHFIAGSPPPPDAPDGSFAALARIRHRQPLQPCRVTVQPDGRCRVVFDAAQRAVTPGQFAVWYAGRVCLGGGVIEAAE